jgi:hypothetical protein
MVIFIEVETPAQIRHSVAGIAQHLPVRRQISYAAWKPASSSDDGDRLMLCVGHRIQALLHDLDCPQSIFEQPSGVITRSN